MTALLCISSRVRLTFAEARRSLLRATPSGRLSGEEVTIAETELRRIESGCMILGVDDQILARTGRRYPVEPVRTIDAIHLATAERIDDPSAPVTILTRDARIRENAVLLGMRVA